MFYIFVSISAFILTLICHIIIFRMFEKFKSETKITILVFTAGLIITGILITLIYYQKISFFGGGKLWLQPIPMTAITVYILLSATFIIFFLYSYLVEESPTSTILGVL